MTPVSPVTAVESFFSRITRRAETAHSLLCVGLDPHPDSLDSPSAEAAREFCVRLIDATAEHACAFKPNSAFFEAFGAPGWTALGDVIASIPEDIPVILDAKRGDIASTAQQYARAAFDLLGADAITVSPYLGTDAVQPFLVDPERGAFLLCKTSNPASGELQLLEANGEPVFLHVAHLARRWNARDNVGLVVGATDPSAISAVRLAAPNMWILAPGVGSQGADPKAAVEAGLRKDGLGILIPVSRSISTVENPGQAAARIKESINRIRASSTFLPKSAKAAKPTPNPSLRLADDLLNIGCVKFGDFELKSGDRSPIYFDLRLLAGNPDLLSRVAAAYLPILANLEFDRLAAVPYAGMPIATAVSLEIGVPMIYPRKEAKDYGTKAIVEGGFNPGETAVLIDDLISKGDSKLEAAERLTAAGLKVKDVVVLIDRGSGTRALLRHSDLRLHSVFSLEQLLDHWRATGGVEEELLEQAGNFIAGK